MYSRTVVAIPASYNKDQSLEVESTQAYVQYLASRSAQCVMTTAGTSHFSLLNTEEVHKLNQAVVQAFTGGEKIIGVPALSEYEAKSFINRANEYLDDNSYLMLLYPERYYGDEPIEGYMRSLREETTNKVYVHGKALRNATGGAWDYTSKVINGLYHEGVLAGVKEEHSQLNKSYDFLSELHPEIDVIVAGGSMRRYEFLESAGANAFLAGLGNLLPDAEEAYLMGRREGPLNTEKKMFKVFMKHGWHQSLRVALKYMDLTCYHNRDPWPTASSHAEAEIISVVEEILND
jgi:dihydrodipicolinate synthase/N-acetylneuraminate lyase